VAVFVVRSATPGPYVDITVRSVETGAPLRSTTHRGTVDVTVDTNEGATRTEGSLRFYVPDGASYPPELAALGRASCLVAPIGTDPIVADTRVLINGFEATLEPDPHAGGAARLVITVRLHTTNLLVEWAVRLATRRRWSFRSRSRRAHRAERPRSARSSELQFGTILGSCRELSHNRF
jgi:hypothetical protein